MWMSIENKHFWQWPVSFVRVMWVSDVCPGAYAVWFFLSKDFYLVLVITVHTFIKEGTCEQMKIRGNWKKKILWNDKKAPSNCKNRYLSGKKKKGNSFNTLPACCLEHTEKAVQTKTY